MPLLTFIKKNGGPSTRSLLRVYRCFTTESQASFHGDIHMNSILFGVHNLDSYIVKELEHNNKSKELYLVTRPR